MLINYLSSVTIFFILLFGNVFLSELNNNGDNDDDLALEFQNQKSIERNQTISPPFDLIMKFLEKKRINNNKQQQERHLEHHQFETDNDSDDQHDGKVDQPPAAMIMINGNGEQVSSSEIPNSNSNDSSNGGRMFQEIHLFDFVLRKRIFYDYYTNTEIEQQINPEHQNCIQQCSEMYQKCLKRFFDEKMKIYNELLLENQQSIKKNDTTNELLLLKNSIILPNITFYQYLNSLPETERLDLNIRRNEKCCFDRCDREWSPKKSIIGCIRAMMFNFVSIHVLSFALFASSFIAIMLLIAFAIDCIQDGGLITTSENFFDNRPNPGNPPGPKGRKISSNPKQQQQCLHGGTRIIFSGGDLK